MKLREKGSAMAEEQMSQELHGAIPGPASRKRLNGAGWRPQAGRVEGRGLPHTCSHKAKASHGSPSPPYCECPAGASAVDRCPPECWPGDGSCAQRDAARGTGRSRRRSRRRRCPPRRSVREPEARARCSSFHDPLMAQGSIALLSFLWASISPGVTPGEEGRAGRSPQGTGTLRS